MSLLQAYNAIHRFDIICLSETYLDNSYHGDDDQLAFPGYNLIRADNPSNIKRGGVCFYYRETLPVKVTNVNILNECLLCELSFGRSCVCLVSIYRTPSLSSNEYDTFLGNFEQLLTYLNSIKPLMLLVTGDFNVRSSSWWSVVCNCRVSEQFLDLPIELNYPIELINPSSLPLILKLPYITLII